MTDHILGLFPALLTLNVTSPGEPRYNCIAWAAGTNTQWWWPDGRNYWPMDAPLLDSLDAFVPAFATLGYERCSDGILEDGFEKIAIYQSSDGVQHASRQLNTGYWTSKLGRLEDIEHSSPAELEGSDYGAVVQYMRRPTPAPTQ